MYQVCADAQDAAYAVITIQEFTCPVRIFFDAKRTKNIILAFNYEWFIYRHPHKECHGGYVLFMVLERRIVVKFDIETLYYMLPSTV